MNLIYIFSVTFLIQFIIYLEMNFINPLIPYMSNYFGIKESSVIYLNMGFSFIGLIIPLLGLLADKYGKKKAIILSMIFFFVGTIISAFATSPIQFAFGRTFIGLGNFTLNASVISYISDFVSYCKRGRATGILRIAFSLAILLSPLYSTYIVETYSLKYLYLSLSALSFLIVLLSFKLPEKNTSLTEHSNPPNFKDLILLLKNPITIKFLLIQFLIVISPVLMLNYFSIWLKDTFALSQQYIGYIFTINGIGTIIGVVLCTVISDKIGKVNFTKALFIIMIVALAIIPYTKSIYITIVFSTLYLLGLDGGWSSFQTICSEIHPERRTVFMTLIYFINSLCILILTIIGPSLFEYGGYKLVLGIATIGCIISLALFFHITKDKKLKSRIQ